MVLVIYSGKMLTLEGSSEESKADLPPSFHGGTRHSSVVALRKDFLPEQIKQGTIQLTNQAFERYFRIGAIIQKTVNLK